MEQFVFSVVTGIPFFMGMQYASHWYRVRQDPKARLFDSRFGVGIAVLALPACWLMHEPRVRLFGELVALAIATSWIYWRDRKLAKRQGSRSTSQACWVGPETKQVVGIRKEAAEPVADLSRAGELWPDLGDVERPLR